MAGFQNKIEFSNGQRLEPSSATEIAQMQKDVDDVSIINFTGDPEGVVSANPSSLCHDPSNGNLYVKTANTDATGWSLIGTSSITLTADDTNDLMGSAFNIFGQQAGDTPVMDSLIAGGNFLLENRTYLSRYVVDSSSTAGLRGTYSTIQDCIDDAVLQGIVGPNTVIPIYVRDTNSLSFTTPDDSNFMIIGLANFIPDSTSVSTTLSGQATVGIGSTLAINQCKLTNGGVNPLFVYGSGAIVSLTNCDTFNESLNVETNGILVLQNCLCNILNGTSGNVKCYNTNLGNSGNSGVLDNTSFHFENCWMGGSTALTLSTFAQGDFLNCVGLNLQGATAGAIRIDNCSFGTELNLASADLFITNISFSAASGGGTSLIPTPYAKIQSTFGNVAKQRYSDGVDVMGYSDQLIQCLNTVTNQLGILTANMCANQIFYIQDISGRAEQAPILISADSGNINGQPSIMLEENYGMVILIWDGTDFFASIIPATYPKKVYELILIKTPLIDFNTLGATEIFTPTRDFILTGVGALADDLDFQATPNFNLGSNSPNYDNIVGGLQIALSTTGDFNMALVGVATGAVKACPAGVPIFVNVTLADIGTVDNEYLYLQGFYQ